MNADGSGQRQLTFPRLRPPAGPHGDYPGARSPDGKQLVYTSDRDDDRELVIMSADGTNKRRLTRWKGADAANAWLPDGRIVVAHLDGDEPLPRWYLIRADGTDLRSLPWLRGAVDPIDWWTPLTETRRVTHP